CSYDLRLGNNYNGWIKSIMDPLIKTKQKDEALLKDIFEARQDKGKFHLWWLGQSGFLLKYQAKHVLIDPYLSDSLTRKYEGTEKPHIRMTERGIGPERLNFIDVVTSSHNHTDHLDADTLKPIIRINPAIDFIIPEANREFVAARIQADKNFPKGLNEGKQISVKGFRFTAVTAAHETIERDAQNNCKFLGYIIQFGPH